MTNQSDTRHRAGMALFLSALLLSSLALVWVHKISPTSLNFQGTMAGIYGLIFISLAIFLVAVGVHRFPAETTALRFNFYATAAPEMRARWTPKGENMPRLTDGEFDAEVTRDGKRVPIIAHIEWRGGGYEVDILHVAQLRKTIRIDGCAFPAMSEVLLTEAETHHLSKHVEVANFISNAKDADDHERSLSVE